MGDTPVYVAGCARGFDGLRFGPDHHHDRTITGISKTMLRDKKYVTSEILGTCPGQQRGQ